MNRFRGALIALAVLAVIGGAWLAFRLASTEPPPPDETPRIFAFEKEDLVGIELERSDGTVAFRREDGGWTWVGRDWRPSASMVRRVGHQTHDLTARATVASPEEIEQYGFGDDPITATLTLADGRTLRFQAGDPNPTSVSWYLRPLPGDTVYVVKKSAVDYWRMDVEDFRERRFAAVDADAAVSIDATVDGRTLSFRRVDAEQWQQTAPVEQPADRQHGAGLLAVGGMLGRTSALKASAFVEDDPQDLSRYGLEPPRHRIAFRTDEGESITLHVGAIVPGTDPQERYILRIEDDAVYSARDAFLEAFTLPLDAYRDTRIIAGKAHELDALTVETPDHEPLTITRTPDGWRWPDEAVISGQTPRFLAGQVTGLRARALVDEPGEAAEYGLDAPAASLELAFQDGEPVRVAIGAEHEVELGETETERRWWVGVDGRESVYATDSDVLARVEDLLNEYRRKLERDAEKGLLDEPDEETPGEDPAGGGAG